MNIRERAMSYFTPNPMQKTLTWEKLLGKRILNVKITQSC